MTMRGLDLIIVLILGVFWNGQSGPPSSSTVDLILHMLLAVIVVYGVYLIIREAIRSLVTTGRHRDLRGGMWTMIGKDSNGNIIARRGTEVVVMHN